MLHCLSCPCKTGTQKAWPSLLKVWAGTLCYHALCGTGQQVGKAGSGDMAERAALHQRRCWLQWASAAFGCPLLGRWGTNSHASSQVYVPTSNSPEALEGWQGKYRGKASHAEWLLSQRKNQAESTFLYSCQKSILTFLQNILTY